MPKVNNIIRSLFLKNIKPVLGIGFTMTLILFLFIPQSEVRSQNMSSKNYRIQGGNFNITAGGKSSKNYTLYDVVGQTSASIFSSKGYIIQSGFLNSAASSQISFTVRPLLLDYGEIAPNLPVERDVELKISNGNTSGYKISVLADNPLSTSVGAIIQDTICNGIGKETCTIEKGALWNDDRSYGFGYRMNSGQSPKDLTFENYYRPLPAKSKDEKSQVILSSAEKNARDNAVMTLKLIIPDNQAVGRYFNVISFTAIADI